MPEFQPENYGPVFAGLLSIDRCRSLGEGAPENILRSQLESLDVATAFAHARIVDAGLAHCCLSGVWLLADFLDESHTISQGIPTSEGSFWHGIMHRREGDFSNAKYWFRKVGDHPIYDLLTAELAGEPALGLFPGGTWDPDYFVDACQGAIQLGGPTVGICRELQQREWELLFDFCYRGATAG